MAFFLRKPSTPCQFTHFNLSGSRGALQAVQQGVSALPPRADIAVRTSHLTRHYLGQSGQVHIDARNADLYIRKVSFGSVIDVDIVPDTERPTTVAVENPAHFSQLADIT